jgi:hypothetical protein
MKHLIAVAVVMLPALAWGQSGSVGGPVVVELFTSQGCSSCPPAEAYLSKLAQTRPDVLPLAFHVTYWDRLGWRDPFSLSMATERQRAYAAERADTEVFTPEAVVQGHSGLVGSDVPALARAVAAAEAHPPSGPALQARRDGDAVSVSVGAGQGRAAVLVVGFDAEHRTSVGRGENAGETLTERNIVRDLAVLGSWSGGATTLHGALPAGERMAVLLQAPDGTILAAARL